MEREHVFIKVTIYSLIVYTIVFIRRMSIDVGAEGGHLRYISLGCH